MERISRLKAKSSTADQSNDLRDVLRDLHLDGTLEQMQSFQISADSLNPMKKQKIFKILRIKPLMNGEK